MRFNTKPAAFYMLFLLVLSILSVSLFVFGQGLPQGPTLHPWKILSVEILLYGIFLFACDTHIRFGTWIGRLILMLATRMGLGGIIAGLTFLSSGGGDAASVLRTTVLESPYSAGVQIFFVLVIFYWPLKVVDHSWPEEPDLEAPPEGPVESLGEGLRKLRDNVDYVTRLSFDDILNTLLIAGSIEGVVLASEDGLVLSRRVPDDADPEVIAAIAPLVSTTTGTALLKAGMEGYAGVSALVGGRTVQFVPVEDLVLTMVFRPGIAPGELGLGSPTLEEVVLTISRVRAQNYAV